MSSAYVPTTLRQRVAEDGRYRCGYCLSQEAITGQLMEIDHLFPRSLGGLTIEEKTPIGRATVETLHLNRPSVVKARRAWVEVAGDEPQTRARLTV